jgi:hypothetical protein
MNLGRLGVWYAADKLSPGEGAMPAATLADPGAWAEVAVTALPSPARTTQRRDRRGLNPRAFMSPTITEVSDG